MRPVMTDHELIELPDIVTLLVTVLLPKQVMDEEEAVVEDEIVARQ